MRLFPIAVVPSCRSAICQHGRPRRSLAVFPKKSINLRKDWATGGTGVFFIPPERLSLMSRRRHRPIVFAKVNELRSSRPQFALLARRVVRFARQGIKAGQRQKKRPSQVQCVRVWEQSASSRLFFWITGRRCTREGCVELRANSLLSMNKGEPHSNSKSIQSAEGGWGKKRTDYSKDNTGHRAKMMHGSFQLIELIFFFSSERKVPSWESYEFVEF